MRKYTQLCLVLITIISIIVLLMYRNEYKQLKYVLDVVNFIGRKDEISLIHLENQTNFYQESSYQFNEPLPIWQRIGNGFHAYSSFWIKPNDLKAGGELITIAIGLKHSIVSFKCELDYGDNKTQKGKFVFVREEIVGDNPNDTGNGEHFIVYKFVCKVNKNFGIPKQAIFTDLNSKSKHRIHVRNLKRKNIDELLTMTLCVNLVPRNQTDNNPFLTEFNLLQYFIHHQLIGVDEFLVYDSSSIDLSLRQTLFSHGIKLNAFPFNFPFDTSQRTNIRKLIEMDCLLRTSNSVKYTAVVTPRDYIYTNGNLQKTPQPLLQMLKNPSYGTDVKLEIPTNPICRHEMKKILSDNLLISSNVSSESNKIFLFKSNYIFTRNNNVASNANSINSRLNKNLIFNNHYSDCDDRHSQNVNDNLVEWRSVVSMEFREYIDQIGVHVNALLRSEN
ncbi:uncharacterized protein LOC116347058 [Contarinia nasturtii]|uniref:uncharacterized protein LOC116347058 n=1 Tax=Contarinia nasturtii TaxID=265458 RepID=UPI0012D4BBB1|nr:uncharacterized protein LOC116347058 [Contarinia nasturtii]